MTAPTSNANSKWPEIKIDIKKAWGKLSEEELEKTKGDVKQITVLLNSKYSEAKEANDKKLTDIFQRFEEKKDVVTDKSKQQPK